jgi:hypothetical protein
VPGADRNTIKTAMSKEYHKLKDGPRGQELLFEWRLRATHHLDSTGAAEEEFDQRTLLRSARSSMRDLLNTFHNVVSLHLYQYALHVTLFTGGCYPGHTRCLCADAAVVCTSRCCV